MSTYLLDQTTVRARWLFLVGAAAVLACVRSLAETIAIDPSTTEIEGWFKATGEWAIYSMDDFKDYNPFVEGEREKCVSLVNATGLPRSEFEEWHAKKVTVQGYAIARNDVPIGDSPVDVALKRRYFEGVPVFNYCLREYYFAVTAIRGAT